MLWLPGLCHITSGEVLVKGLDGLPQRACGHVSGDTAYEALLLLVGFLVLQPFVLLS